MEMPLVSVCMTTYNHEPYIAEAIESVLAQQTSFGVELVVGEDCSTDRTAAICREYAAKYPDRIRLVTSPENVGWRANYRRTFEACRGKYVAYLDGDDWWCDPRKLQMQADLLESAPSCGCAYARQQLLPEHRPHRTRSRGALYRLRPPACRLTIANCATLARRDLIARYAEARPDEPPNGLPTTPRCGSGSAAAAVCATSRRSRRCTAVMAGEEWRTRLQAANQSHIGASSVSHSGCRRGAPRHSSGR